MSETVQCVVCNGLQCVNTKYLELYGPEIANQHRERYLKRATKIRGDWQDNPFSANNLSINLLWNNLT